MDNTSAAIFLFDVTGNMAKPWAEAGYLCYCVDTQHKKGETRVGNIIFVGADARNWRVPYGVRIVFVACFPPCTHLATSGARWFKGKGLRLLSEAIELFAVSAELCEWAGAPYQIENPVSTISTYWRKPDHTFHPWHYAGYLDDIEVENTTKATCLWTGGGFIMPVHKEAPAPHRNDVWRMPPSDERANLRSRTPNGYARAVFLANVPQAFRLSA
jgi:hypothetical protein